MKLLPPVVALLVLSSTPAESVATTLVGVITDRDSGGRLPEVRIAVDGSPRAVSAAGGVFTIEGLGDGEHRLGFSHIAYDTLSVEIVVPLDADSLRIELRPHAHAAKEILVTERVIEPSLPPRVVSLTPDAVALSPGNIANDPLRALQTQASTASSGIDFNSEFSVRGADPEEHRFYLDGLPLEHASHARGFAPLVAANLAERVDLIPGAAPLRYRGNLSGVVHMSSPPVRSNEYFVSYDITSIALGLARELRPSLSILAAGKSSFFNLPVYQQVGVDERSFRDAYVRLRRHAEDGSELTVTAIAADDSETGDPMEGVRPSRSRSSILVGALWTRPGASWEARVQPYVTYDRTKDAVTRSGEVWAHRLHGAHIAAEVERGWERAGILITGLAGVIDHAGQGGDATDPALALGLEAKWEPWPWGTLVVGAGGSKEPWTDRMEPEAYGSVSLEIGNRAILALGFRRSHQTPFLFARQRHFASIAVDDGDLFRAHAPSWRNARAVQMDQGAIHADVQLGSILEVAADAYARRYRRLLTWSWDDDFRVTESRSDGNGEGQGYEIELAHRNPRGLTVSASFGQARIDKLEGILSSRRPGDYDLEHAWRLRMIYPLGPNTRLSLSWQDLSGRPYTALESASGRPETELVNRARLPRYQRLDVKLLHTVKKGTTDTELYVDVVNVLNRLNIAARYTLETSPGVFTFYDYGGARFMPVAGVRVRFW